MCVFVLLESVIAKKIIDVHVFVVFFQYQIDFYKANCASYEFSGMYSCELMLTCVPFILQCSWFQNCLFFHNNPLTFLQG